MNKNRVLGLLVMALFAVNSFAQMTFAFANNVTPTVQTLSDGTILVYLPEGTELDEGLITEVKVAGTTVDASKVVPVDKLSVVITLVLAFVFLHEQFTTKSLIGCILIGIGTLVMVL